MAPDQLHLRVLRTPLGQARGLGAAHAGVHHWSAMRWTSYALLPLTIWFVVQVLRLGTADHAHAMAWAHLPWNAVLLLALVLGTFHHLHLGLQTVIEDYVHEGQTRLASLLLAKGACALLALAGTLSILKLAL